MWKWLHAWLVTVGVAVHIVAAFLGLCLALSWLDANVDPIWGALALVGCVVVCLIWGMVRFVRFLLYPPDWMS